MARVSRTPAAVQWWPAGEAHGHMVVITLPGESFPNGEEWEDIAIELADQVQNCSEDRHRDMRGRPHGKTHSLDDVNDAFKTAINQFTEKAPEDFEAEWEGLSRKIAMHKKWGGHMPALVLTPDAHDPKKWWSVVPDEQGNPLIHSVRNEVMKGLVPPPEEGKNAYRDKSGIGWVRKRRLTADRRLHRIRSKE